LKENGVLNSPGKVDFLADFFQDVEGELRSDQIFPVGENAFVDGTSDFLFSPLEDELQDSTSLLFLHVLEEERLNLFKVFVDFFCSVFNFDFHDVLDGRELVNIANLLADGWFFLDCRLDVLVKVFLLVDRLVLGSFRH
jgi:hypothetical protein